MCERNKKKNHDFLNFLKSFYLSVQQMSESVKVAVRCRPMSQRELQQRCKVIFFILLVYEYFFLLCNIYDQKKICNSVLTI